MIKKNKNTKHAMMVAMYIADTQLLQGFFGLNPVLPLTDVLCLVTQSCPTLCDPMNCSPPGSSLRGILQEIILKWVAMPSSRDLPNPGFEPRSPALQVDSLPSESP